jgi:regulation of enolase protein 1 (concanavalin A-like superfamily)
MSASAGGTFLISGTHTYAEAGHYVIKTSITGSSVLLVTANGQAAVEDRPLTTGAKLTIAVTAGAQFNGQVATLTDAAPAGSSSEYVVTINWGDGTKSAGVALANGHGGLNVTGAHIYSKSGTFSISTRVVDGRVSILTAAALTETKNARFGGDLIRFIPLPGLKASDYTANIEWGDGTTSAGSVLVNSSGGLRVNASHTFVAAGIYLPKVDLLGGPTVTMAGTAKVKANPVVNPWRDADIGSVGVAGSSSQSSGVFTVKGSGADIFNKSDAFHFVYQTLSGNGTIIARVISQAFTNSFAKAGVMMRASLSANAVFANMVLTPGFGPLFETRTATGQAVSNVDAPTFFAPYWVKLVRKGNAFTSYISGDGKEYTLVGSATIVMSAKIDVGLAVTSHNNKLLGTGLFDHVLITSG